MITVIRTAMKLLGYTNRDLERKLGLSASYLSRLFSGMMELRFEHVVDLSQSMGLDVAEMLHFAFPTLPDPPTEAAVKIREAMSRFSAAGAPRIVPDPPPPPPPSAEEKLEKAVAKLVRKLLNEVAAEGG